MSQNGKQAAEMIRQEMLQEEDKSASFSSWGVVAWTLSGWLDDILTTLLTIADTTSF